jgi:hypothetical protein
METKIDTTDYDIADATRNVWEFLRIAHIRKNRSGKHIERNQESINIANMD